VKEKEKEGERERDREREKERERGCCMIAPSTLHSPLSADCPETHIWRQNKNMSANLHFTHTHGIIPTVEKNNGLHK
jgi:hypothetical protein